ncbi:putative glutamine amidotransferase [Phycisphaerae bacterium RAS1]|nr:putative glutamine amidotransferase [Phycisphaerae bacterium RAS1]
MRPIIGLTSSFGPSESRPDRLAATLNAAYADAIYAAGGLPWPIVPPPLGGAGVAPAAAGTGVPPASVDESILRELLSRVDGLLFTGGPDLNPVHYGQPRHEKTSVLHDRRDRFDMALFRAAGDGELPLLSICLGCQIANVACGGQLVQHVDDLPRATTVEHYKPDHSAAYHAVTVEPSSRLARIVGRTRIEVNSRHHQVVDREHVGGGLRAVAYAPDGVVEAIEAPGERFLLAVQWHPEDMIDRPEHLALFRALVEACADRRAVLPNPPRQATG